MKLLLTLGSILMIGPIFGLLGTVVGMIQAFNEITMHGTGDAAELATGISMALVTTEIGMIFGLFGIISLITGHILRFKNEPLSEETNESDKSYFASLLLNLFLGVIGAHHFYAGRIGLGVIYLLTFGGFIVGQYIDFIKLAWGNFTDSDGNRIRYKSKTRDSIDSASSSHSINKQ